VNELRPAFVIVCGDLVNAHPDIYPSLDVKVEEKQVEAFKEVMSELEDSIPLVCVCGNHDVGNTPTPEYMERYRKRFGDDYFSFWIRGIKCIVLNMQLYSDPSRAMEEYEAQNAWFRAELAEGKGAAHVLVFGHIPW